MSFWLEIPRPRLDGRHKASRRTTVRSAFQNFREILSWIEPGLDGVALSSGRSHFSCTQFIKAWHIRTMTPIVQTVNLMSAISIYEALTSGSWRPLSGRLIFKYATCLTDERVRTGIHIVQTIAAVFPYLCFGKKTHSWSNTEWRPNVLLKRPNGCKLEQFEASRHRGRSGWKVLVVRTDDALDSWASGRYITSSGLLQWIRFLWLVDCEESSRRTLNSWIPV